LDNQQNRQDQGPAGLAAFDGAQSDHLMTQAAATNESGESEQPARAEMHAQR
jgi:hypothetical protein